MKVFEQLEAANAEVSRLTSALAELQTATASHAEAITAKDSVISELMSNAQNAAARIATLEAEAKTASERAVDIAAAVGVPPVPAADPENASKSAEDIRAEFAAISDPVKANQFYQKHRNVLKPW